MRGGEWTPERRAKAAERIRQWAPWAKSTGPRTAAGKNVSKMNALDGRKQVEARQRAREMKAIWQEIARLELDQQFMDWIGARCAAGLPLSADALPTRLRIFRDSFR